MESWPTASSSSSFILLTMAINIMSENRKNALNSSWIKRLLPNPQPPTSIPITPLHLMPAKIPQLPLPSQEVVGSSSSCEPIVAFGPFRVPNARESKLVDRSSSTMEWEPQQDGEGRKGSASRDGTEDRPAASRNAYNPPVSNVSTTTHPDERRTSLSSEAEEPFSYWNMGRLERKNFVSSACPPSSSSVILSRKRTANMYAFIPSKFPRFRSED